MVDACSIIVGYQHYAHDDTFETGAHAAGLLVRTVNREIKPTMSMRKAALLSTPFSHGTREPGPMRQLYRWRCGIEASGRRSIAPSDMLNFWEHHSHASAAG
jgi:microcystin degradation protein MlrC